MTEGSNPAPKDVIGFLDYYLVQKAPFQIPDNAKEWIVRYGPWITVVMLVLALPPLLFVMGIGTMLLPFGGVGYATGFGYMTIGLIAELGLRVAALPGLFARKMSGWRLLFYAQIVNVAFMLLGGSVVGAFVSAVVSMYVLFQVRSRYTA